MSIADDFGPGGAYGGDVGADTPNVGDTAYEQLENSAAVSQAISTVFGPGGAYGGDVGADTDGVADTAEQQIVNLGLVPGDIQSRVGQAFGGSGNPDDPDPEGETWTVPNPDVGILEGSPSPSITPVVLGVLAVIVVAVVGFVGGE